MASKGDIDTTNMKLDKIMSMVETMQSLIRESVDDAFQRYGDKIISKIIKRSPPQQKHRNNTFLNMDGQSSIDDLKVKIYSRTLAIGYEADQDSDSEIPTSNPYLLLRKVSRVKKKYKRKVRKKQLRPKLEEGNTQVESGDNTDVLIEKTMAHMEAAGTLNIDQVISTADKILDNGFSKANLNEKDSSKEELGRSSPCNRQNDHISNTQDTANGRDSDLELDGLLLQINREGGNELSQHTLGSLNDGQKCFSDDSDTFEKIPELPKENAKDTHAIRTGLQRLWIPLNNRTGGQDEGYISLDTNCSSLLSNTADISHSLSLLSEVPDVQQYPPSDESSDDENYVENNFDSINTGPLKNASLVHNENLYHMDPVQLLESASLTPNEVLKSIICNALKDPNVKATRENGMDTVVLWDVSGSTSGKLFQQIKGSVTHLLHSINFTAGENIGLVTIGRDTKILHQLTNSCALLLEAVETVTEAGGTTPLTLGLLLCHIEIQKRGGPTSIGRYHIPPRIIIISDGRPTEDVLFYDEELERARKDPLVKERVLRYGKVLHNYGYQISCISVGASSSKDFLTNIARAGEGTVCEMDDISSLYKHFLYQSVIGRTIALCKETGKEEEFSILARQEIRQLQQGTFDENDVDAIIESITKSGELRDCEISGLPPLGSRVKKTEGHSSHGTSSLVQLEGTVIKHIQSGFFKVLWDDSDDISIHNNNSFETNELIHIDTPRPYKLGKLIAPGMGVVPVTGEGQGRVFEVTDSGFVKIRWSQGEIEKFTYDETDVKFQILPN